MNILLDSDFLFGLFVPDDVHHKNVTKIIKQAKSNNAKYFALNLVIQESATVISKKRSQGDAVKFVNNVDSVVDTIVVLSPEIETRAWRVFKKQKDDGISFVDCANLVALKYYKLDRVASFDRFYPKKLLLK